MKHAAHRTIRLMRPGFLAVHSLAKSLFFTAELLGAPGVGRGTLGQIQQVPIRPSYRFSQSFVSVRADIFLQNFTWEELIMTDYPSKCGAVCMDGRHFTRRYLFTRQTAKGEGQS